MDKYMYYCKDCDKLYKVAGSGRKVKCNKCQADLVDLMITDVEYESLDSAERNSVKYNARMSGTSAEEPVDDAPQIDFGSADDTEDDGNRFTNSLFDIGDDEGPVNDEPAGESFAGGNPIKDDPFNAPTVSAEPEKKASSKGSFFDMMPDDPSEDKSYSPIYAFDQSSASTSSNSISRDVPSDDDDDDKKVNFFLIPFFSFIPTKYDRLVREKGGKVFGALLIWFIILNVIAGIFAAAGVNKVADELKTQLPDFDLSNGRLTIDQPLVMDEDGSYIMIDDSLSGVTAADIDEVYKSGYYKQIFIGGSDSAAMLNEGKVQVLKYSDLGGFEISRDKLCNKWIPMLKPIIILFFIIGALFSIGFYYIAALILQFPAGAIAKAVTKGDIDKTDRFRITVLAKFPVFVLVFIIKKIGLSLNLLVNVIMQLIFIVIVMYLYIRYEEMS